MSFSRVLFIGLGGAGQRHLRILRRRLPDSTVFSAYRRTAATPLLNPDFSVAASGCVEAEHRLTLYPSLEAAFAAGPELTVISTPTACHREPLMMAAAAGSAVLVEKPWAESLDGFTVFRDRMLDRKLAFQISFQRRYHPLIAQARALVADGAIGRPMAATFTVFSHVPSWHPYEDWRQLYAVRGDLGGGVLLTEIHEIDLAYWMFGVPEAVFCSGGNRCGEPLEIEDTVQLTLLYPSFSAQITLCFMHARPSRRFHIAGSGGDIVWDADGNRLTVDGRVTADPAYANDSMFDAQAAHFLEDWNHDDSRRALESAGASLAIVAAARGSLISGRAEPVVLP